MVRQDGSTLPKDEAKALSLADRIAMNHLEVISRSPEQTHNFGVCIGELALAGDVILLTGNLGTGKTCLTQGIARGLNIKENALSPSFIIVREHQGRLPLYHMDLYRLDRIEEIAELGLDEYLCGNGVCVVEWAEKGHSILPAEHLLIEISYLSDNERILQLKPSGQRYLEIMSQLKNCPANLSKGPDS